MARENEKSIAAELQLQGQIEGLMSTISSNQTEVNNTLAYKLQCKIQNIHPTQIKVADGTSITCDNQISNFVWSIQGEEFTFPIRLLQVEGFHMVLVCDWLEAISHVEFDYKLRSIQFKRADRVVVLRALQKQAECTLISADSLYRMLGGQDQHDIAHIFSIHTDVQEYKSEAMVEDLLSQYSDVFAEPQGLPPLRGVEHHIILKERSIPKQIYPYRYSHTYKGEIEKIVQELLDNGMIRQSQSPFASSVLLVRKKDSTETSWKVKKKRNRRMRTTLQILDSVEEYPKLKQIGDLNTGDDIVPGSG